MYNVDGHIFDNYLEAKEYIDESYGIDESTISFSEVQDIR